MSVLGEGATKNLVSIHYPGVVKSESKMLETLGGVRMISSTFAEKNRRLELRFRPDDVFCKPAYAVRKPVTGLIMKIKVKKKTQEIISYEVVGNVTEEYRFSGLCDFQYLPATKEECIYKSIVPKGLDTEWLRGKAPYFLPPVAFSRIDTVQSFNFSKVATTGASEEDSSNVIGRLKRKRYGCTKIVSFDNPEVPTKPRDIPVGSVGSIKLVTGETLELLKQLFQERPIFSRSAITCISKVPSVQLKCLLPCVAYYFINGPWRSLWVRFGYDPRKDPSARIYQTLDYRVRSNLSKEDIKNKRSYSGTSLPYKFTQTSKSTSVISRNISDSTEKDEEKTDLSYHQFRPGVVPPSRQCYYQFCDIQVPEIQDMLEKLPEPEEQETCHEVIGWLTFGFSEACREIMNKYVSEEIKRRNSENLSYPSTSMSNIEQQRFSGSESDSEND